MLIDNNSQLTTYKWGKWIIKHTLKNIPFPWRILLRTTANYHESMLMSFRGRPVSLREPSRRDRNRSSIYRPTSPFVMACPLLINSIPRPPKIFQTAHLLHTRRIWNRVAQISSNIGASFESWLKIVNEGTALNKAWNERCCHIKPYFTVVHWVAQEQKKCIYYLRKIHYGLHETNYLVKTIALIIFAKVCRWFLKCQRDFQLRTMCLWKK